MYNVVSLFERPQQTGIYYICYWCGRSSKQMVCPRNSRTSRTGQTKSDSSSTSARSASGKSACLAPNTQVDDCVAQPLRVFSGMNPKDSSLAERLADTVSDCFTNQNCNASFTRQHEPQDTFVQQVRLCCHTKVSCTTVLQTMSHAYHGRKQLHSPLVVVLHMYYVQKGFTTSCLYMASLTDR